MLGLQEHITFKSDTHQYFDPAGEEYKSVSRILDIVKPEFDRAGISANMARVKAKEEGISVDKAQEIILAQWDQNRDSAADHGTFIHDNLEDYLNTGQCDSKIIPVGKRIIQFLSPYYKYFPEAIIYSGEHKVSGTADLPVQRTRTKKGVWDFYDYKTNQKKGIQFDSIKREGGKIIKHYNRFLREPLTHLEDCNYNHYCLQLALYAYMAEITFDVKPGRLGIIFIDQRLKIRMHNVPYMRMEAKALLDYYKEKSTTTWGE